jgi:chromosome segregation ATPase
LVTQRSNANKDRRQQIQDLINQREAELKKQEQLLEQIINEIQSKEEFLNQLESQDTRDAEEALLEQQTRKNKLDAQIEQLLQTYRELEAKKSRARKPENIEAIQFRYE